MLINLKLLPVCDFVIRTIHLESTDSLNYSCLPNVGTFHSKKARFTNISIIRDKNNLSVLGGCQARDSGGELSKI